MRGFKTLILWIEGTEDKNDLDINWSATSMEAFKRFILWVEGTEGKNDLDINWSVCFVGASKDLYYGLKVLRTKKTSILIDQLPMRDH